MMLKGEHESKRDTTWREIYMSDANLQKEKRKYFALQSEIDEFTGI